MRFHLDSDQIAIQDTVRGALQDAFPRESLMAFLDDESDFEPKSWKALMELGLAGLMLDEGAGGSGLGLLEAAISVEALGRGAAAGELDCRDPGRKSPWGGSVRAVCQECGCAPCRHGRRRSGIGESRRRGGDSTSRFY